MNLPIVDWALNFLAKYPSSQSVIAARMKIPAAIQPANGLAISKTTAVSGTAATIRDQVNHIGSSRFQVGKGVDGILDVVLESDKRSPVGGRESRAKHQSPFVVNLRLQGFGFRRVWLVLLGLGLMTGPAVKAETGLVELPAPFWAGKPKVREKLEDRDILVSVRTESGRLDEAASRLVMSGVGWVKRAPGDVFEMAKSFEKLPQVSEHFREVKFDAKTSRLFVISQALGYQARMLFQVQLLEQEKRIRFHVIEGHFLGLRGEIEMANVLDGKKKPRANLTEMSVLMAHEARELPVPKFLIGFALEIVSKNVAQKMRRFFETGALEK